MLDVQILVVSLHSETIAYVYIKWTRKSLDYKLVSFLHCSISRLQHLGSATSVCITQCTAVGQIAYRRGVAHSKIIENLYSNRALDTLQIAAVTVAI
jgi:hypothetical protein